MRCAWPVTLKTDRGFRSEVAPCGRCLACRINRRRRWTGRFLLESLGHETSTFATLTVDDEHQQWTRGGDWAPVETLSPGVLQKAIKRLRRRVPVRFAAVGEYGGRTGRAHYHAIFFGPTEEELNKLLPTCWGQGHFKLDPLILQRAAYLAGYTVKGMTQPGDERLNGLQHPEFARFSLRPPIGYGGLDVLEELHYTVGGAALLAETGDVAAHYRVSGRTWPIDRTMRRHLRRRVLGHDRAAERIQPPDSEETVQAQAAEAKAARRNRVKVEIF